MHESVLEGQQQQQKITLGLLLPVQGSVTQSAMETNPTRSASAEMFVPGEGQALEMTPETFKSPTETMGWLC